MILRHLLISHPLLSLLIYAWLIGAGTMFLPLLDAAYQRWREDRPMRERTDAALRTKRRAF